MLCIRYYLEIYSHFKYTSHKSQLQYIVLPSSTTISNSGNSDDNNVDLIGYSNNIKLSEYEQYKDKLIKLLNYQKLFLIEDQKLLVDICIYITNMKDNEPDLLDMADIAIGYYDHSTIERSLYTSLYNGKLISCIYE